jgi:hypothetical protein
MPAPISWKSKIFLVKPETVYGTDASPTGSANAILAVGVTLVPMEGDDTSRELELPWMGAQASLPSGLRSRIRGRIELVPSGTRGTAPAWGPLLRACGVAEVVTAPDSGEEILGDVTYSPISEDFESVTIHFWIGGTRYVLKGARGTGIIRANAQGIPYFEFDMLGLFTTPSETTRATPDLSKFKKPKVVSKANTPAFTINAVNFVMRNFALNLGNRVEPRLLVGHESIIISDKTESVQTTVEGVPLTTYNPYSMAEDQTSLAIALTHGKTDGDRFSLSIPTAQQRRPASLEQSQNILEWPLEFLPLPGEGNDQWTLTLT